MRSMLFVVVFLVFMSGVVEAQVWTPPENPDPQTILSEAGKDVRLELYELAHAKYLWLFEHSVEHNKSFGAVRLTSVISGWGELGKIYEPAKSAIFLKRDEAAEVALNAEQPFEAMHELASINRNFDEDDNTRDVFLILEQKNPERAKQAYFAVRDPLLRLEDFETLGRYIKDPEEDLDRVTYSYRHTRRLAKDPRFDNRMLDTAERQLTRGISALIVTLVKNDRVDEAKEIAKAARTQSDSPEYQTAIDDALNGKFTEGRLKPMR